MKQSKPLPTLVASSLIAAVLYSLVVKDGWLVLIPTILALAVVSSMIHRPGR